MAKQSKFKFSSFLKRNNVKRFFVFVIIAFVFLLISKFSSDYKQVIDLELVFQNLDDEIILEEDLTRTIEVRVEAKGFTLIPFIFDNKKDLPIDAEKHLEIKDSIFIFNVDAHKNLVDDLLGKSYKILSVEPDVIEIPFSVLASKKVPVVLNKRINYASGFDVDGNFKLNTDSVKIVGAQSEIKHIARIQTDTLMLMDVKDSINSTVKLNKADLKDIEVYPNSISVSAKIARFTEGTVEVPVLISNQSDNVEINYFPKSVSVLYYVSLEKFKSVRPSDFRVECDFSKVKEGQTFFIPELTKQPESVKRTTIKPKRIDFIKL